MKTFYIDPFDLKEHKKASALIPEMTEKEWEDFFNNVKEVGIRQPLDINKSNEVLDGRHRLRAAKKLKLEKIEVRQLYLTEEEEMEFVRDTAIERRNLSVAQKHKIVTDTKDLIKSLYEKGKNIVKNNLPNNQTPKSSVEPTGKKHDTNEEIGKMIGASRATAQRLNKIKREAPEVYEKVVKGEKSTRSAYDELPTVEKPKKNQKRGDVNVKKEVKEANLYDFKADVISEEEEKQLLLESENETLKSYLRQLKMLLNNIKDLEKVISLNEDDERFFIEHLEVFEILKENVIKKYGSVTK